jgi:hypothetical protein
MECEPTRRFCRTLEAQGAVTYPLVGNRYAPPGWPDRYIAHEAWQGFVEFKKHDGTLKKLQARRLQDLELRRVSTYVLRLSEDEEQIQVEDRHGHVLLPYASWSTVSAWLLQ